ncbi:MAG: maltose alpha-D-glucosyltransferase [Alphaproteobacteria bacterium]
MIDRSDPLWFKDAIIYQLHVKAFFDGANDGIGDIPGLIQKLDYVRDLGVTTIWLLPFYPSPLRDDGYDIADYRDVNPRYGTMRDLRRLIREAHARGLRVITELVINHTSDQHPWFQRARQAPPGSNHRNFYVWSDTDQRYPETRIIFLDTESSNWSWDPVAKAYYWHRFYSHQPDLNFDNPAVLDAVVKVMHFWFDLGVDGMRLDAVPYLVERDGTNNENLPETHAILKKFRTELDKRHPDRLLLAEANQWPEDTQEYFGQGDECHMAFHFPLMPRMYMAIAQEDRHPVTDIMRQTPEIPENCQWAIFLRNHDELTLEMVTDQERDYLWNFYAVDRRARINLGIRRRLAPLLENDRAKIELMNSLLLSMPGTPIIYYGDEIGMGDNIFLGDRDGVRTPMQWSPDRNGGFSRADPASLFLPAIMDPIYGYEAVNVEAQQRNPSSLLNWMRRMIAARRMHRAFGRGALNFLYPGNRKILAYLREHDGETILCVVNLARAAQAVELDLSRFRGRVPIELLGRSRFPPIGDLPYLLTLDGHGFYWFLLADEGEVPHWHQSVPEPLPEFVTLVMRDGMRSIAEGRESGALFRDVYPDYLPKQRWFAAKDARIAGVERVHAAVFNTPHGEYLLVEADVTTSAGDSQRYFVPLAASPDESALSPASPLFPYTVAKGRRGRVTGPIYDALADDRFALALVEAMREGREIAASDGVVRFAGNDALRTLELPADTPTRRIGTEQSNSSVIVGEQSVVKIYRRLSPGIHPELEMSRFLTEVAGFRNTPTYLGAVEHVGGDGTATALAVLQGFLYNQGDGWTYTVDYLVRFLEERALPGEPMEELPVAELHGIYLAQAATLGLRTGQLHRALAIDTEDPAFAREPIDRADMEHLRQSLKADAAGVFQLLGGMEPTKREGDVEALLERRDVCLALIDRLASVTPRAAKTRLHGDYHLGQVLVVKDDFHVLDFEGEPARSLAERRAKGAPAKDVAGMLRSFDYAAWAATMRLAEREQDTATRALPDAMAWRDAAAAAFLDAYRAEMADVPSWPEDPAEAQALIDLYLLEKALYEIRYEASNRPAWLGIPVRGLSAILDEAESRKP